MCLPIMTVFVCLGTVAELIKLAPVVVALRENGAKVVGIATGQNDLRSSDLYATTFPAGTLGPVMSSPPRPTTLAFGLWAALCLFSAPMVLRRAFRSEGSDRPKLIVHGDTVSTLIATLAGRIGGAEIVHVEAGLRSFHLLRPFPEELCRIWVSRFATWAFCPGEWAVHNLRASRIPHIINTQENTLADSMRMALARPWGEGVDGQLPPRYFLFICHRQENLLDNKFLRAIIAQIEAAADNLPCVAIIHKPAAAALAKQGLLNRLELHPSIKTLPRQGYIDFTHMLQRAEYIVTDGGSNQEESFYLGKPCLLLRKETERHEGLGENVILSRKDPAIITEFFKDPYRFARLPFPVNYRPSIIIAAELLYQTKTLQEN